MARSRWLARAAVISVLCGLPISASAQFRYEVVTSFYGRGGGEPRVIQASDGAFYGTRGREVFRIDPGGTFTMLHRFGEDASTTGNGLIQGRDGNFYGTIGGLTPRSGGRTYGFVFRMDPAGNVVVLHRFTGLDGADSVAPLVEATDGWFYGTTDRGGPNDAGTIFRIDANGSFETLHSFTGTCASPCISSVGRPQTGLIQGRDGSFFGTTRTPWAGVFRMDAAGRVTPFLAIWQEVVSGPPLQGPDGALYVTTRSSDSDGYGSISKFDPSGSVAWRHRLTYNEGLYPVGGLVAGPDGVLYGTAISRSAPSAPKGTVFKIDGANGTLTLLHGFTGPDGAAPAGLFIGKQDNRVYGTTSEGGPKPELTGGMGTLFTVAPAGGVATVYAFDDVEYDGLFPAAGLVEAADGTLYGTTAGTFGTVFKIDARGLQTLHRFTGGEEGGAPDTGLIQARDGRFYGVTSVLGAYGHATAFRIDADGTFTTLHQFTADEGTPTGRGGSALLEMSDGAFLGTTTKNIFRMTEGGEVTLLHTFTTENQLYPGPHGLIQAQNGSVYGTTASGSRYGSIFRMDPDGTVTTLHTFSGPDGYSPAGRLLQATNGSIYGVTSYGGATFGDPSSPAGLGYGTVFRIDLAGAFTTVHHFTTAAGGFSPQSGLVQGRDGRIYGTTAAGGSGSGTIFRLEASGPPTTVHQFEGSDGRYPRALLAARDGSLYGASERGGRGDAGVIFRLVPSDNGDEATAIPGHIEAEDYDRGGQGVGYADTTPGNEGGAYRQDDVDIKPSQQGGYAIGWFSAGEWLAYTIDVPRDGAYTVAAHVGSALPGRTFHLAVDGADVTGPIAVPNVGAWDTYGTARRQLTLSAGRHVLRVVMGPADFMEFQSLDITEGGAGEIRSGNDFDGDGRTDLAVFRPGSGGWYISNGSTALGTFGWGLPGDVPLAGDFDHDGQTDLTVWRPSTGTWYIRESSSGYSEAGARIIQWGLPGDVPLVADFDGDGQSDLTVFRPSVGMWYVRYSSRGYAVAEADSYQWGLPGDLPLAADFDGDGRSELTVFRPSLGMWYVRYSSRAYGTADAVAFQWGLPGDVPLPADFDGDGLSELTVFRPSVGTWYVRYSSRGYAVAEAGAAQWGLPGDVPISGDFDGDGRIDLTVYRPATGQWFVRYSTLEYDASRAAVFQWGLPGDIPVP